MNHNLIFSFLFLFAVGVVSCKKQGAELTPVTPPEIKDTVTVLKDAASFPFGLAVDYTPFLNDPLYRSIVIREANTTTFGYHMKHGAIVNNDGSFNYTATDNLFNAVTAAGLTVFGHTLAWHQNQNGTYLRSLTMNGESTTSNNVLLNGDFEGGSDNNFTNWSVYNANGATFTAGTNPTDVYGGARSLKITNPTSFPGEHWKVQMASELMPTEINELYKVSFWIKSHNAGGIGRLSTQPSPQYQSDFSTSSAWAEITWTFTAKDAQTRILFDMGSVANTYFIDNVTVKKVVAGIPPDAVKVTAAVDSALSRFIRNTVTRYAGKVKAWDVVNEPVADGASGLRTSANTQVDPNATDYFFWSEYLGRNYALKAFQYAKAADPAALLFINDYNLEYNRVKLDSLLGYVSELRGKGAPIDGIGTQMHISTATSLSGIDQMFQKLAATGLKIRVSELDIRINPTDNPNFIADPNTLALQASMYKYVVESYLKYVPAAQRHGITVWGVSDKDSWIVNYMNKKDNPLLFDYNYQKKPAYFSLLKALEKSK